MKGCYSAQEHHVGKRCLACDEPITLGESITHSRRRPGFLHEGCKNQWELRRLGLVAPPVISAPARKLPWATFDEDPLGLDEEPKAVPVPPKPAHIALPKPSFKPVSIPKLTKAEWEMWWMRARVALLAGCKRVLLVGPPGTGKSTLACEDSNHRITSFDTMDSEWVVGIFVQKANATVYLDGAAPRAMKLGTTLVIDEVSKMAVSPSAGFLYALMDDRPELRLPTGEMVECEHGYNVILTDNGNPNDLPDAILDRVDVVLMATTPHADALKALPVLMGAGLADEAEAVMAAEMNYYAGLPKTAWQWRGKLTHRSNMAYCRLRGAGVPQLVAAEMVFGEFAKEALSIFATAAKKGVTPAKL